MGKLKKILCCMMAGIMLACTVPTAVTGLPAAKEVQAAVSVPTPSLVSATPYGKTKIVLKWKPVKGIHGYRIYRRTNGGKWQTIRNVSAKATAYTDLSVISGNEYTYTVRAYRRSGKNVIWGSYVKKGVKTIAGLNYLKINVYRKNLYVGDTYDLKINGTKLKPVWSTNNYKIAGVYSNGRILAKKPGKARITGVLGGKKFTCDVTVKNKPSKPSQLSQNYTKVINFINKYGKTDSYGDKYIAAMDESGNGFVLQYFRKEKLLDFGTIVTEGDFVSAVDVLANCTKSDRVYVQWVAGTSEDDMMYAESSMYASRYTGRGAITFRYENGTAVEPELKSAINQQMHATFESMDYFLKESLKISVKDLGFKSYR